MGTPQDSRNKIISGWHGGEPTPSPPPIPDEGGALGGFALLCSIAFSVAVAGVVILPIPAFLFLALVGAPAVAVLGGVLGLISIFSRSARNRLLGFISLGITAIVSCGVVLAFLRLA